MQNNGNNLIALAGRPLDEHVRAAQTWLGSPDPSRGGAQRSHDLSSENQDNPSGLLPLNRACDSQSPGQSPRPEVSRRCFLPPSPPAGPGRGQILFVPEGPNLVPYRPSSPKTVTDSGEWPAVASQHAKEDPTPLRWTFWGFLIPPVLMRVAWWVVPPPASGVNGSFIVITLATSILCGAACTRWTKSSNVPAADRYAIGALYTFVGAVVFGAILGGIVGAFCGALFGIPCAVLGGLGGLLVPPTTN